MRGNDLLRSSQRPGPHSHGHGLESCKSPSGQYAVAPQGAAVYKPPTKSNRRCGQRRSLAYRNRMKKMVLLSALLVGLANLVCADDKKATIIAATKSYVAATSPITKIN